VRLKTNVNGRHEHLSAHAIHDDPVATLGPKAVAYSTVTQYFRKARVGTAKVTLDVGAC
jgi:hypothetical protein